MLRNEIDLDTRFGHLSEHLKNLTLRIDSEVWTTTHAIAAATGLPLIWVSDAIEGDIARVIFNRYGAVLVSNMGSVEVPAHIGNPCNQQ